MNEPQGNAKSAPRYRKLRGAAQFLLGRPRWAFSILILGAIACAQLRAGSPSSSESAAASSAPSAPSETSAPHQPAGSSANAASSSEAGAPAPNKATAAETPPAPEGAPPQDPAAPPLDPAAPLALLPETERKLSLAGDGVQTGKLGGVASVEVQASKVGVAILERGGNAVDAAVATAFALAVTHPSAGNIGGGGFMMTSVEGRVRAFDFREDAPAAIEHDNFFEMIARGARDGAAVGVPGTVAGLYLAHQKEGKLPWAELLAPAIALSREGSILGKRQAKTVLWATKQLWEDPVGRTIFYEKKREARAGERVKNPRLARTLERIAQEGPSAFYQGPVAEDIIASLGEEGLMTLEDLARYQAREVEPLAFDFQERRVITMPAPSAGGVTLTQILKMMEASGGVAEAPESFLRYHYFLEASRRAQVERRFFVSAPERHSRATQQAQRSRWLSAQTWLRDFPIDAKAATPSYQLTPLFHQALKEVQQTTHFGVVDAEGNAVSCTVTLSGSFGIRRYTRETGIVLNNSVASFGSMGQNVPQGGVRTVSSMAPTLVFQRGAQNLVLVLGSPGGDTIPSTIAQLLLHLLDEKSLKQAILAPRVHQGFVPDEVTQERYKPLPDAIRIRLGQLGHRFGNPSPKMGDANLVAFDEKLGFFGASDWREGGVAIPQRKQAAPSQSP